MLEELSVDDLKQRLQDKEQMVATLTEYLEQAAEKLNHLQQHPPESKPAQAFDAGMVERQRDLVAHLKTAVEEWEQLQAPLTLERISTQLDALREMLVEGLGGQTESESDGKSGDSSQPEPVPFQKDSHSQSEQKSDSGSALEGWEALKAEMLNEEVPQAEQEDETVNINLKEELEVLVNRPEHVDEDCEDLETWQNAVDSREKYMISLIRALRVVEGRRRGAPDWDSFTEAPVQLREQAGQLAAELQQTLRNSEVELSIERARISRQDSVIAQQRREIDKAQKKQGNAKPTNPNDSQQGRWLKFLGRSNNDNQ